MYSQKDKCKAGSRALKYNMLESERPREKAQKLGFQALTDGELLAIIIGSGTPGESVVDLCNKMLRTYNGNLAEMGRRSIEDLTKFRGVGPVKAIELLAALELGRRYMRQNMGERVQITNSDLAYQYLRTDMDHLDHEEMHVLMLDRAKHVIKCQKVGQGGTALVVSDLKLILKAAILNLADSIILAHNHPSDNPNPSPADDRLTQHVKEGCQAVGVTLVDHIIVCRGNKYYSYGDKGRL